MSLPAEPSGSVQPPHAGGRRWAWVVLGVLVVIFLFVLLRLPSVRQQVGHCIQLVLDWIKGLGPWGPACFAALFVATTVLLVSSSFMMAMAGFLFGMAGGFLPVITGCTLGAVASFLLGRTLLQNWVQARLAGHPLLLAIDKVVEQKGFRIVLLTRLTPAPSVLMNYGFGLTKVKFWSYAAGTALGMLPRALTYLYVGSTLQSAGEILAGRHHEGPHFWIHIGVGAGVTVVVVFLVGRMAHKALKDTLA